MNNTFSKIDERVFSNAFYAALVISSTPLLFPSSSRVMSMGARTLSTLISFLYFSILGYSMIQNWVYGYVFLVALIILSILTSLFTVQTLTLISLILSVVSGSFHPIIAIVAGWVIAYFIPILGAKVIISEFMVSKWVWYYKNQKAKGITKRNSITNLLKLPIDLLKFRMKAFSTLFANNSLLIIIHSFPLLIFYLLSKTQKGVVFIEQAGCDTYLYSLVLSSLIVFLFTSFKKFLFLGQAERYLEFLVVPVTVVVLINLMSNTSIHFLELSLILITYNLILVIISFLYNKRYELSDNMKETVTEPLKLLGEFMKSMNDSGLNVLTIPTKFAYYLSIIPETRFRFYYAWMSTAPYDKFRLMEEDLMNSEMPIDKLDYLVDKYGIGLIIFESAKKNKYSSLALINVEEIYSNEDYLVYKILK
jgi:hypothetical protein